MTGRTPELPFPPPRRIGRYAMFGPIASGGMATVHFGMMWGPVGFSRTVAIKQLRHELAADPGTVTMLLDEARLASRVRHPNVVAMLDVVAEDGDLFLVMEYVAGETLARLLAECARRKLRVPQYIATAIIAGGLHGLHAAHTAKSEHGEPLEIVHRDVSPQNILVGSDGLARVLDFGIAKARGRLQTTRDNRIKGKLAYMAPEQVRAGAVTRRTDVFAAGIVLWEMLTGMALFRRDDERETLMRILDPRVSAPSAYNEAIGASLDRIVMKALDVDPGGRFASARDFAVALEEEVGLATPRQVAEWVETIAGSALRAHAEVVASIQRSQTGDDESNDASSVDIVPVFTDGAARTADPSAPAALDTRMTESILPTARTSARRRWLSVAFVLVTVGLLVGVAALTSARSRAPSLEASPVQTAPPQVADAREATPPEREAQVEAPILPPSSSAKPAQSAPTRAPVRARAPGGCNPPYTIDARGVRRLKPQCM